MIHAAGVLADKAIAEKTDEQFARVFDTKVRGLLALLEATAEDPLDTLCLFSSIAARTGNVGQSDYAMANEVLNAVACAERARRAASGKPCVVRAIGWGPWDGGMVTPALREHFRRQGVPLLGVDAGAAAFVDELVSPSDDTSIVIAAVPVVTTAGTGSPDGTREGGSAFALGGADASRIRLEATVSPASHPFLRDHVVGGAPVLPAVIALEWFVRAAAACRPDLSLVAIENLKVLRGAKLTHFEQGETFVVHAAMTRGDDGVQVPEPPPANGVAVPRARVAARIALELRGAGDVLHYTATATLARTGAPGTPSPDAMPHRHPRHRAPADAPQHVYDGHTLFHGRAFQVVRRVESSSAEELVTTLGGTLDRAWPSAPWRTDVAALDGALQSAVLWTEVACGEASLPMSIGSFRVYRPGLWASPLTCIVRQRRLVDARALSDVVLLNDEGEVLAELAGVETVVRPPDTAATGVAARRAQA